MGKRKKYKKDLLPYLKRAMPATQLERSAGKNSCFSLRFINYKLLILLCLAFGLILFFILQAEAPVARVNGEPLTQREFLRQLRLERTETVTYFYEKYGALEDESFWNRAFPEGTPAEYARQRVLNELVSIKVQQLLAKEYQLLEDLSYQRFLKDLRKENKARAKAMAEGQVLFGPVEYDENGYFTYTFSHLLIELKKVLLEKAYPPDEDELYAYYLSVRAEKYARADDVAYESLYIPYSLEDGRVDENLREEGYAFLSFLYEDEIEDKPDTDWASLEALMKSRFPNSVYEKGILDENGASSYSKAYPLSFEALSLLEPGQIGTVLDEGLARRVSLVRVLDRQEGGYKAYEEYGDSILFNYGEMKYEELVASLIDEALVEINSRIYERMYP